MVTEAQKEQKETVESAGAKPPIEDTPEFREALQKAIRQGTSKYQQQAAEAKKAATAAKNQAQAIQNQLEEIRQEMEIAKLSGDDVDSIERARKLLQREQAAEKRLQEAETRIGMATEYERRMSVRTLHEQYGIPIADLEDIETLTEMRIAAVEYENAQLKKGQRPSGKSKVAEDEERESKSLDTADGRLGTTKIPTAGTKEFEEFYSKVKAGFSR